MNFASGGEVDVRRVKARHVRRVRLLRRDEHHVTPRVAPEACYRREIPLEPLTVARF